MLAALTVGGIFQWILDNWSSILASAAMIVAASSALIKALEVLVAILVKLFPGLKTVDGDLKGAADWLDSLAKSGFLTKASLSPKPADATAPVPAALKAAGFAQVRILALVAALTGVAMLVPSCAALRPFPGQAAECGKPLIGASPQLLQDLTVALASGNWSVLLDQALIDSGPVVFCLVGALVTDLEHQTAAGGLGSGPTSIEAPSPVVQLGRARMWLAVRGR